MAVKRAGEDELRQKSEIAVREEEVLIFWRNDKTFQKSLDKEAPQGDFVFYDGPPFATGLPHHGSLLSSIIKDVIPRYKTMQGFRVRRRWGWDTHGLPIENLVEKELGLKTKKDIEKIGIAKFNETARSMVLQYVEEWRTYIERIGRFVDYDNSYKTMDTTFIESVWWAFKQFWQKGLLYEGRKVLMYCPHDETPLAKAEIAADNTYKDITEEALTVKFKIKNPEKIGLKGDVYLLAWTTTPWTLPGNVALAVNPEITYAAEGDCIFAREGGALRGKELIGLEYEPLFEVPALKSEKSYKVYGAEFVNTQEGTGIVHVAPIYGEDDYALGQKERLPMVQLLSPSGFFNDDAPALVRGKYFKYHTEGVVPIKKGEEAEKYIKDDLESRKLIFKRENRTHAYPHCWRCSTPLIYNAVPSWFVDIQKIKEAMLKENEKINWYPGHLKHGRFGNILANAPDWTISRNRFWASPLPIWKCEQCKQVEVIGSIAELKEKGATVPDDLHRPYIDESVFACSCGGVMRRIPEVVDCWVESGSMPFAEWHYPFENKAEFEKRTPADFIAEYIAQTRTWFYYLHAVGVGIFGHLAFKNVVSTGTILAADGEKLSKSKRNYTDPLELISRFGADAFRLHLMGSVVMQGEDLNFRDEDVRDAHNRTLQIFWNCVKFFKLYSSAESPRSGEINLTPPRRLSATHILDRWILSRLNQTVAQVTAAMDCYDTPSAVEEIKSFITDYSTWYVRRSRERVKGHDAQDKEQCLATQHHVLSVFSKVVAPITPFIAESVWRQLGAAESVHLSSWPEAGAVDEKLLEEMAQARAVVSEALKQREGAGLKIRQPLSKLTLKFLPEELKAIVAEEVNVKEIVVNPNASQEIVLDTNLTPELQEEGVVRNLMRQIQEWRKEQKLSISDRPTYVLKVSAPDATVAQKYREKIIAETGLSELVIEEI